MLSIRPEPAKFLESLRFVQYILVIPNIDSERQECRSYNRGAGLATA